MSYTSYMMWYGSSSRHTKWLSSPTSFTQSARSMRPSIASISAASVRSIFSGSTYASAPVVRIAPPMNLAATPSDRFAAIAMRMLSPRGP